MAKLTDERLLSMAAKALGYASIDPERGAEEGPGSFRQALEVFPEELIAFARAVLATEPPAPAPAADDEREKLAQWLYCLADERICNRRRGIRPHPSALRRAAALLQQAAPAPMPAAPTPDDFRRWWRETGSDDSGPTPEMLLTANAWAEAWAARCAQCRHRRRSCDKHPITLQ